jgi:hypothetical protein
MYTLICNIRYRTHLQSYFITKKETNLCFISFLVVNVCYIFSTITLLSVILTLSILTCTFSHILPIFLPLGVVRTHSIELILYRPRGI